MEMQTRLGQPFNRTAFDALIRRRLFYTEAFEVYRKASDFVGDNRGLYDYGPPGASLQNNILDLWRKHFVLREKMLEVDCTVLTPEEVFKTSGHVDRFADWMCRDVVTGDYIRADHLVEAVLKQRMDEDRAAGQSVAQGNKDPAGTLDASTKAAYEEILAKIDNYDGPQLGDFIKRFDIRNPYGNSEVLPPVPFNLMFKSSIGPSAAQPVYLRPETAQGQFLNFSKLLKHNNNKMPFASASVGKAFRNEISPRSGLLRVREFLMAEIEHFVDPEGGKKHSKFDQVAGTALPLLDRNTQLAGTTDSTKLSIGDAVSQRIIDNETLGYFLARIQSFLLRIGVDKNKLRFRQHLPNEMAHYASDCWDAELLTSYGWIECVGCADRSTYDLTVHMRRTKEPLVVKEALIEPKRVEEWQATFDKRALGITLRSDARLIEDAVLSLNQESLASLAKSLANTGAVTVSASRLGQVNLDRTMLSIEQVDRVRHIREYVPNVIEPSFGIGRILYSLLEHVYYHRPENSTRAVLSLPLSVAPTKVLIVPLSSQEVFVPILDHISQRLDEHSISNHTDDSGASIGKRYARNDELGTPLAITVDFDTAHNGSVTLRERDSTQQVRGTEDEVIAAVLHLVHDEETWQNIYQRLPHFSVADTE